MRTIKRIAFTAFLLMACLAMGQQPHPSANMTWAWSQGTGDMATGFHIQRSATAGGPYTVVGTVPVGTLTYLDTSVTAGQSYFYVVTAYNSGGDSSRSNEVACTIPFQAPRTPTTLSVTVQ